MKLPSMDPLSKISAYQILLRTGLNNYKKCKKKLHIVVSAKSQFAEKGRKSLNIYYKSC